jgi:acyl-CoA thioesterase-1
MGYTLPTRKLLEGKANVHRVLTNGGPTIRGLEQLPKWLGSGKWDVIHFNWGLHDLRFMDDGKRQVSLEDYEKNLRRLVAQLRATGARLIWASTTPVPSGKLNPLRKNEDVIAYNAVAKTIMDENRIPVDDLYALVLPQEEKLQLPANVHFTPEGYQALAEQVAASIQRALAR